MNDNLVHQLSLFPPFFCLDQVPKSYMGRDNVVCIATLYGLDGPGIEFLGGEIFCNRPERPWSSPSPKYSGYRVSFAGVKGSGRGAFTHPIQDRVKRKSRTITLPPLRPFMAYSRVNFTFYVHLTLKRKEVCSNTQIPCKIIRLYLELLCVYQTENNGELHASVAFIHWGLFCFLCSIGQTRCECQYFILSVSTLF